MQAQYLNQVDKLRKMLMWLAVKGVEVHGFKCIDKPIIQVSESQGIAEGFEKHGCILTIK